jgi:hypothetical protein
MTTRLSHNLPPLRTSGNRIINSVTGVPILLRGINRSGLEYSDPDEQGPANLLTRYVAERR